MGFVGPVEAVQGMGLLLGLVCDRPAAEVRDALLDYDVLTGTSADPDVLRILAPLVLAAPAMAQVALTDSVIVVGADTLFVTEPIEVVGGRVPAALPGAAAFLPLDVISKAKT